LVKTKPFRLSPNAGVDQTATRRDRLERAGAVLGLDLDPLAIDRLLGFVDQLQKWNAVYNLTGTRDRDAVLVRHLFDCLAVIPALRRYAAGRDLQLLDVGSGGGLPGAAIAIMQPRWKVYCIDAIAKKSSFVRQVALELGLHNLTAVHGRVELAPIDAQFDIVIARAFASLAVFAAATRTRLADGGIWIAMKGKAPTDEIAALEPSIQVFHVEPIQVPELAAQRCLIWMRPSIA
jgi:16S rRNA (guanine527-N7)-methyltransferase